MKTEVHYNYDQDPRYGWVNINTERKSLTVIVQDSSGQSYGFEYSEGEMRPTCICYAYDNFECGCTNLPLDYWE